MRRLALLLATLAVMASARAELILNVTLDYDQERDHFTTQSVFSDLARQLSTRLGQPVKLVMTQNAERVGERIRTESYDLLLAPAQMVGLAMRHGYTPVARTRENTRVMLVSRSGARIANLEQARGKPVAMPHRESLVSYLVRGELNALGTTPDSYFGRVMHMNQYGAVMYAMDIGQADLAAVKESVAREWAAQRKDTKVVKAFNQVPMAGVAVSHKMDEALRARVREAFISVGQEMEARLRRVKLDSFAAASDKDFEFVSTRGFYTPEVLPGATLINAAQAKTLIGQGVPLYDVRPKSHYREAHIPGAINVTYELNSPKEPDADDTLDRFDLTRLPKDKNAPMIFQCNGAECWYSYKASRYMVRRGYTKVYWFRTGIPDWKASGYPLERGA
ncbi:MAG: PhnD/SsuA/transferrin family substrate-binding protein [Thiobacillaceae bacterium]|nr:PhnD/SsuA/transferrin family substrate-binding protein [Thiobacillaceae bacterium]